MHFIRFPLRLSPLFTFAIVLHSVIDRIVLFTVKVKVHLWFFFCFFRFSLFFFFLHKVRFSCFLLAWVVYIPFHLSLTVRISKPTLVVLLYGVLVLILLCYLFLMLSLFFPDQKDFQREDAMWLNQKATQKKQSAAAIIWRILLSYLITTETLG